MKDSIRKFAALPILSLALGLAPLSPAEAAAPPGKLYLGGDVTAEELRKAYAESFPQTLKARGASPTALPDIFGPGAVLRAGNVVTKITNIGIVGNPFATSTDPAGQWPGQSGIEYMNAIALAVGGVEQVNGQLIRRVTFSTEWRPPSIDAPDKIYSAYEGIVNGVRNNDDDGDGQIDEDFLDGQNNDGDGQIDEDYAAQGQQMFSHVMTDFSPQSLVANVREQHVPLTVRVEQKSWGYSLTTPNLTNFDVLEYTIRNVSGNAIDSLFVGWLVDFDAGPAISSNYFQDDQDIPWYPQGWFIYDWTLGGQIRDPRVQLPHSLVNIPVAAESALCQRDTIRINGFSVADDNGDDNTTTGVPSFLLFNYTLDPTGLLGPKRVQWRAYRSFTAGTPFGQGGNPTLDIQRYEFMSSTENIQNDESHPMAGFITAEQGDQKGDYTSWVSVGPWLQVPNGGKVEVSVGFAVDRGTLQLGNSYRAAYENYVGGDDEARGAYGKLLLDQYPSLNNAFIAQIAFEGVWELNRRFPRPDFHGRETKLIAEPGQQYTQIEDCEYSQRSVLVTDREYYWFDLDCDLCTGIWDYEAGLGNPRDAGYFHKTWNTSSPPPSPATNASGTYNYTDNPDRAFVPGNNNSITIAWDNLSEMSPDPAPPNKFDFRGYKVWKVSDWSRPVGSPGPAEEDWALVAEFRLFSYYQPDGSPVLNNLLPAPAPCEFPSGTVMSNIPCVFIPVADSNQLVYLERGDIWNQQTGQVIKPANVDCRRLADGSCESQEGCIIPPTQSGCQIETRTRYEVGRYSFVDTGVKNGFLYFYSVTAFDSTDVGVTESRRSAVESEGVVPQAETKKDQSVTVVPNPYRGYANIQQRPSSWDLTPNSTDPTGTHIDFYGMPAGTWTLRIFTISGDLVQEIHSGDAVNESLRAPVTDGTTTRPGYTRQQDTANDGQASWNLISRNGQDIVSGIYLFTVDSNEGIQRGKFVVIR